MTTAKEFGFVVIAIAICCIGLAVLTVMSVAVGVYDTASRWWRNDPEKLAPETSEYLDREEKRHAVD